MLTSGTDYFPTLLMERLKNKIFVKAGAEGVMGTFFPENGWAFVVKARDGAARAAEVATARIFKDLGYLDDSDKNFLCPEKTNWAGTTVSKLLT
jgi:L-asparaginase II